MYPRLVMDIEKLSGNIDAVAEIAKERNSKKVIQYDKSGNFIKDYDSAKEAEIAMGNTQRHICDVANGRRKSAYGYIWRWKE